MEYAFAYGADAVYAGQPRYSLRVRENEFNHLANLGQGISRAHDLGKQFYIASNISPHNNKIRTYLGDMQSVIEIQPDALIMSDPGLIMLVRERWPDMPIHLSVQANAINWATVRFWQRQGLTRIILSRELALDEIEEIKQRCPQIELEVFVHGAFCIAYSGRCLLSGYLNHRDSNQGACTNSCRWKYQAHAAEQTREGDIVAAAEAESIESAGSDRDSDEAATSPLFLLQEKSRPGEYLPAYEDEHGSYIMNSKDLRAVQHVRRLMQIGVESLKIEGRTKSYYYAARTTQVYRRAIDDAAAGKAFDMQLMDELEGMANRGFTEGFYRRHPPAEYQNYAVGNSSAAKQQFVADVERVDIRQGRLSLTVKNKFSLGDELVLLTPAGNTAFRVRGMFQPGGNETLAVAPGSGYRVDIPLPDELGDQADPAALDKALLVKNLS